MMDGSTQCPDVVWVSDVRGKVTSVGKSVCLQKCAWPGLKFSGFPGSSSSRRHWEPFSTFLEKACGDVYGDASGEVLGQNTCIGHFAFYVVSKRSE